MLCECVCSVSGGTAMAAKVGFDFVNLDNSEFLKVVLVNSFTITNHPIG